MNTDETVAALVQLAEAAARCGRSDAYIFDTLPKPEEAFSLLARCWPRVPAYLVGRHMGVKGLLQQLSMSMRDLPQGYVFYYLNGRIDISNGQILVVKGNI